MSTKVLVIASLIIFPVAFLIFRGGFLTFLGIFYASVISGTAIAAYFGSGSRRPRREPVRIRVPIK